MKILLLAGEESGVIYANQIKRELLKSRPDAEIRGYGDCGFEIGDLAVFGVWEVLRRIGYFLRVKRTMERMIDEWRPDVVCTVDYPGMNLKLAAYAKSRGIRAVHVVCPQVWAWKKGRIPKIEASLDRLCCFFPFEPAIFRPGLAEFVGHPLVDQVATEGGADRGDSTRKVLAVLPGSRMGEIEHHMPTLRKAIDILQSEIPSLHVIIPAANDRAFARISALMKGNSSVEIRRGGARDVLRSADAAAVASGTATFEAAMTNCPFVLVYKVGALLAAFLRRAITGVRHVGLINIIAEKAGAECPMPELLQENFTVENLLSHLRPWLLDSAANGAARTRLSETMKLLRSDGKAIAKIAAACLEN